MRVKLENLVITSQNPRITAASDTSLKALVASMGTHGLIQPLVVRPLQPNGHGIDIDGRFEVIAGSRRLQAAQALGWTEIEVVENDAEYGVSELGAAENMIREAMHPLDECRVISRLVADGEPLDAIGGRFGQSDKWVQQRIKLNDLCGEVQDAFRDGDIGMAAAQAFTLGDHDDQKAYLKKGLRAEWMLNEREIKAHFQKKAINARNALFALSEYPQDQILSDLFGEEMWCQDRAVFDRLQRAAMTRIESELVEKDGWGSVIVLTQGPDYKITNRYVRVEGRILKTDRAKYVVLMIYTPASGSVTIEKGWVLRKEADKIKAKADAKDDTVEAGDVPSKSPDELSGNQLLILGVLQTSAIEHAIADGDVYLALLTLLGPLLGDRATDQNVAPWAAGRRHSVDYEGANKILTDKLEDQDEEDAVYKVPSRKEIGELRLNDIKDLLCKCALRSMYKLPGPMPAAAKALKQGGWSWLRLDEGFLKRYRQDALEELARRMKVHEDSSTGYTKATLIQAILSKAKEMPTAALDRIIDLKAKDDEE